MKRVYLLFIGLALLLVAVAALLKAAHSNPVALIQVVDPSGKPVAGAIIKPDGLKPKKTGGHYLWMEDRYKIKPLAVTTDKDGFARVTYPFYVMEKLETGEISFAVNHPDFVPDRPIRVVSASPTASTPFQKRILFWAQAFWRHKPFRVDPVVLQPGAVVKVTGFEASGTLSSNLFAEVTGLWAADTNTWWKLPDGSLLTRRVPAGKRMLRLVAVGGKGAVSFSEAVQFEARPGETNAFRLEVKPGLQLHGKLSDNVPRPVSEGRVIAEVWSGNPGQDTLMWHTAGEVNSNGDFVLQSLPSGQLEIVGIREGFVSANGPPKPRYFSGVRIPQVIETLQDGQSFTLEMEQAAALQTTVLDDQDRPLAGATVGFWPNVVWGGFGTRIFASDLWCSLDGLLGESPRTKRGFTSPFEAVTDTNGEAIVRNLPPDSRDFAVNHPAFEMRAMKTPWGEKRRTASALLTAGQTNETTVRLQKRGSDAIAN